MARSILSSASSGARFNAGSIISANCDLDGLSNKKYTTTTISRNIAQDNSVQINGSVANKIYHIKEVHQHNHYTCCSQPHIPQPDLGSCHKSADSLHEANSLLGTPRINTTVLAHLETNTLLRPNLQGQDLSLHSSSGTAFEAAHARFRTPVRDHFISIRIVRRLNVKPTKDSSMIKRCILNNQFASSTSYYVDLACYGDADRYSVYRLFVVIDPPFDLLFGFTVNGQSAVTGDKKRAAADRPKPA